MTVSIGVDATEEQWRVCVLEDGEVQDCAIYEDGAMARIALLHACGSYPEPHIAIAARPLPDQAGLAALSDLSESYLQALTRGVDHGVGVPLYELLLSLKFASCKSYILPVIAETAGIAAYRRLVHPVMGDAAQLCAVATLCYRMRQRDASWSDMNFLYLGARQTTYGLVVVKDGMIIDGIARTFPLDWADKTRLERSGMADQEMVVQAFWEALRQDLAALMATYHQEDIVVIDRIPASVRDTVRTVSIIDRLGDDYQLYHFPHDGTITDGFEVAAGAAVLAEGLHRPGLAADVVQRLLLSLAQAH